MNKTNENRPGYKKTKVGWIPIDWESHQFSNVVNIKMGQSPDGNSYNMSKNGIPLLNGPTEFTNRYPEKKQWTSAPTKICDLGDILLCVRGSSTGRMNIANDKYCIGRGIAAIKAKKDKSNSLFIEQLMIILTKNILRLTAGSTFPNIDSKTLSKLHVPIPPLPEQKKIAQILTTWDKTIEQTRQLIEAKKQLKKGLMQQLLTGKKRFKEFGKPSSNGEIPESWKVVKLKSVLKQIKRSVNFDDNFEYDLVSIRRRSGGLFQRESLKGKDIKTKDLYLAQDGDFLISKMQVVHGALGLVTKEFDLKYISGSYIVLIPKEKDLLDITYFDYLSKTPAIYHAAYISSYGVHIEKMTFNLSLFLKTEIMIPENMTEQKIIIDFLNHCDTEIKLLNQKQVSLQQQKKGLMQKLLTGAIRVKIND